MTKSAVSVRGLRYGGEEKEKKNSRVRGKFRDGGGRKYVPIVPSLIEHLSLCFSNV